MKKAIVLTLVLAVLLSLAACGGRSDKETAAPSEATAPPIEVEDIHYDYAALPDTVDPIDGMYQVAFVSDSVDLFASAYNLRVWEGVKRFCTQRDLAYKAFSPAAMTDAGHEEAVAEAASCGADLVVCTGNDLGIAIRKAAMAHPEVRFAYLDGEELRDDSGAVLRNVKPLSFREEQAGYLAGYAAVMEGYTKLGFSGGGGGKNPACCKYGYGFLQGASAAAKQKNTDVELRASWKYGDTFADSPELTEQMNEWYKSGTEVVFSCGGSMCLSAFQAADAHEGYVIGVDSDQSGDSVTVITSAIKDLREAAMYICGACFSGSWDSAEKVLGARENAVGLPLSTWCLEKFSTDEYLVLLNKLRTGSLTVSDTVNGDLTAWTAERVTVLPE